MKIELILKRNSPRVTVLENITEIHYNYRNGKLDGMPEFQLQSQGIMIAFESDIDCTGYTYPMNEIEEFEVTG